MGETLLLVRDLAPIKLTAPQKQGFARAASSIRNAGIVRDRQLDELSNYEKVKGLDDAVASNRMTSEQEGEMNIVANRCESIYADYEKAVDEALTHAFEPLTLEQRIQLAGYTDAWKRCLSSAQSFSKLKDDQMNRGLQSYLNGREQRFINQRDGEVVFARAVAVVQGSSTRRTNRASAAPAIPDDVQRQFNQDWLTRKQPGFVNSYAQRQLRNQVDDKEFTDLLKKALRELLERRCSAETLTKMIAAKGGNS